MLEGLLPIGSVVLLKDASKRLMIIGVCRKDASGPEEKVWDYVGCYYPEGYISEDHAFLFNGDQIETVFALGFQDEEQFAFKEAAERILKEAREENDA